MWDVTSVNAEIYRSKNFYSHIPCGMWRYMGLMYPSFLFHFYSHIPCGMWRELGYMSIITTYISTHTSRVGCDAIPYASSKVFCYFYSHIPCGMWRGAIVPPFIIKNFYSHIPCGMWQDYKGCGVAPWKFLLTHPVWDVTNLSGTESATRKFLLTHPVWDVTLLRIQT